MPQFSAERLEQLRTVDPVAMESIAATAGIDDPIAKKWLQSHELVLAGKQAAARTVLLEAPRGSDPRLKALWENDLGVISALECDEAAAQTHFLNALKFDPLCAAAAANLSLVTESPNPRRDRQAATGGRRDGVAQSRTSRVALLSLLFNWPSTGGGTVHTAETGKFLSRAGYDVRHFYAQFTDWGLGNVAEPTGVPSVPLAFATASWNAETIQRRFREAVDAFQPDYVIITDSWNFKPLLAKAVRGYRYFLRLAALECLCPLNNVRLLVGAEDDIGSCPRHQLATPTVCRQCVTARRNSSGRLHQLERTLSGFDDEGYSETLHEAFAEAEGVLVVNPLVAEMVRPFAKKVHVVPSGFDSARFPWPWADRGEAEPSSVRMQIFFAGLIDEFMKGFRVLHEACRRLWQKRQDFELVATGEPIGRIDPFTRFVGWLSQEELPSHLRQAAFLVFPTIAEEALGRSAVEAMGSGRPVIASRIGGLQFTVAEGATGLLFEPGNVEELTRQMERLLDDPPLRERMGQAARERFERHFTWDAVIKQHYLRLMPLRAEH